MIQFYMLGSLTFVYLNKCTALLVDDPVMVGSHAGSKAGRAKVRSASHYL